MVGFVVVLVVVVLFVLFALLFVSGFGFLLCSFGIFFFLKDHCSMNVHTDVETVYFYSWTHLRTVNYK